MAQSANAHRSRHPLGFRMLLWLVPRLLDWYMRFVYATSREIVVNEHFDTFKTAGKTCLYVSLHQGLLYFIQHYRDRGTVVMASQSRDGDMVTAILERFGWRAVRGSSSRGGKEALQEMIPVFRDELVCGGLICDAPRGPYGVSKIGIVLLARDSENPITPCGVWSSRKLLGRNWDRTLIPLPFSRIALVYGEPIPVPADATREECERIRGELGPRIVDLVFHAQEAVGEPRQDFRAEAAQEPREAHA